MTASRGNMPKVELPGAHARFTDHQIRIARAGAPYPDQLRPVSAEVLSVRLDTS